MNKMYKALLMDHYHNPSRKGVIDNATFSSKEYNPSCGDAVSFAGIVDDDIIIDIAFTGSGCVISQATASILADHAVGKMVDSILSMTKDDVVSMLGITLGPVRLKCALLPLMALQKGLQE